MVRLFWKAVDWLGRAQVLWTTGLGSLVGYLGISAGYLFLAILGGIGAFVLGLAGVALWRHLQGRRWPAPKGDLPTGRPTSSTDIPSAPPVEARSIERISLTTLREWALEAGWDSDDQHDFMMFSERLAQAGYDGEVAFWGRDTTYDHGKDLDRTRLVRIPTDHFAKFGFDPIEIAEAPDNYDIFTTKPGHRPDQFSGSNYRDIHAAAAHAKDWLAKNQVHPRARIAYDTPVFKVVAHVANIIDDWEDRECFPRARRAIRQAALDGELTIRGNKSARIMGEGDGRSAVETTIPREYWETADLSPMATDKTVDDSHPHTYPHKHTDGTFGEMIFPYWKLRLNWEEVLRRWPAT